MSGFVKRCLFLFAVVFSGFVITGCKVSQIKTVSEQTPVADTSVVMPDVDFQGKVYHASRTRLHDLLHTRLDVRFDWEKQRLEGIALLQLKPYFYPQNQLMLDAKNFDIHKISIIDGTDSSELDYFYDNEILYITLDTTYTRCQSYWLEIRYTAKPAERELKHGRSIKSDQGLYFINHDGRDPYKPQQIWTQGETESNSAWFPTIDVPNEQCTQEMYITVDNRFKTLSNGELVYSRNNNDSTRTDFWKMDKPHAPYLFMMAVGDYEVVEDSWYDLPMYYYVEPEYKSYARDIFGNTPEMIGFFSEILGVEFPWPKYAQVVVRDFVSGAMENTSATVFMEDLQVDSRELIDDNWDDIIAHELFHHWFGNLVTCESWANLTLNEAFANYSEYLWKEYKSGRYEADLHGMLEMEQYFEEAASKQVDLIRFDYNDSDDMFDNHTYAKGGRIVHMLRKYVGDEAFYASLNYYLEEHQHQSVEIHDLRLAFEKVTGEDLNWFFNQWFLASGHPLLEVSDSYVDGTLRLEVYQLQDLGTTPLYTLPLYVDIFINGKKDTYHITVDKEYQAFEFNVSDEPDLVLFDGEQQLLAEIHHEKTRDELFFQFMNTDLFLPRYLALDSIIQMPMDSVTYPILISALKDNFWLFRQMSVGVFEDYTGPYKDEITGMIHAMAMNDPKSLVRADAVSILYSITGDKSIDLYKKAIHDSSYAVAGNALFALSMSDPSELRGVITDFLQYNNFNIVIPLASYFIDQNEFSLYDWFVEKLRYQDSEGLYYMLQYFGEFLMDAPELMKRRGLVVLEKYARDDPSKFIRLSAYQSIGFLSDLSEVEELRADIRDKERDEFLRDMYRNMQ